ncbi:MAG: hypothetical protein Q9214_001381 [Letrouitia sp. 1 TL-2023]
MNLNSGHTSHSTNTDGNTMPPQRTLTAPTNATTTTLPRASQYPPPDAPDPAYSSTPYTMPNSYPTISEQNDTSSGASSYPRGSYQQASPASNYHSPNRSPQSYTRTISPPVNVPPTTLHNSFPNQTIFGPSGKPKKSGVACDECRKKKIRKGRYARLAADCTYDADILESRQVEAQREGERAVYGELQENAKLYRYIQDMGSTITRLETQIQRQSELHRAEVQSLHAMIQRLEVQLQGCHETIERHERLLSTSQNVAERDGPRNNGLQRLATAAAEDDG